MVAAFTLHQWLGVVSLVAVVIIFIITIIYGFIGKNILVFIFIFLFLLSGIQESKDQVKSEQ